MSAATLQGWTPFRAAWLRDRMIVDWCHLDSKRFVEPFFYETIVKVISHPFNQAFQQRTGIEVLRELPPGLAPSGFIFHMSRCGSTLCAQALAATPANIVISEAIPIRAVLRAAASGPATPDDVARWLAGMVNALAQPRFPDETRLFVKFMAADVLHLPLITRVFPGVPWIFLYRDPVEILASHQAVPSAELMPGYLRPDVMGLTDEAVATMAEEVYWAHCLAALGRAALEGAGSGRGLVLRYDDLPYALLSLVPAHFGWTPDEADEATILAAARRNAKAPAVPFVDDSALKQHAAAEWRDQIEPILRPTYARLEQFRGPLGRARNATQLC